MFADKLRGKFARWTEELLARKENIVRKGSTDEGREGGQKCHTLVWVCKTFHLHLAGFLNTSGQIQVLEGHRDAVTHEVKMDNSLLQYCSL